MMRVRTYLIRYKDFTNLGIGFRVSRVQGATAADALEFWRIWMAHESATAPDIEGMIDSESDQTFGSTIYEANWRGPML